MNRAARTFILGIVLLAACRGGAPIMQRDNLVHVYGKGPSSIRLEARVHHIDEERSILYFKLNTADLLYKGDGGGGPFKARARITYGSFPNWESRQLLDSASTVITDASASPSDERELIGSIAMQRKNGSNFVVKVVARDLHRDNESAVLLRVQSSDALARQHFMPIDPTNGLPLFGDHQPAGRPIAVRNEALAGTRLHATRHPVPQAMPTPVFSTEARDRNDPAPDSSFTVALDTTGRFDLPALPAGIYHFAKDSLATGIAPGYTLVLLDKAFPWVDHGEDLLKPLRFITSMQEFERISKEADARKAIERFWIDASGDRERAREAIRIYYGRAENANRHFSALTEGWRTDRGLVHIIFGTPTTIYRSDRGETWTYGEENNIMSLSFNFVRRRSAFSDNDLWLERDATLKGAWYRNVESWRNGRVYQN